MLWSDFYDNIYDWADSTKKTKISSLENIGDGVEVVDAVLEIQDEKVRAQLIRKAMKLGVQLSSDDFMNLDGEFSDELYEQLGKYCGYDHNDPYFDEDNMEWDDFYGCFFEWEEALLKRRIEKLTKFGPTDEVCDAVQNMPDYYLGDLLYAKARAAGVKFTNDHLEEMGHFDDITDNAPTDISNEDDYVDEAVNQPRKGSGWFLAALFAAILGGSHHSHKDNGRCDGDCANCPAHYGYRYGRWYYGHGHQHGCERHGNGGRSGKTYRD